MNHTEIVLAKSAAVLERITGTAARLSMIVEILPLDNDSAEAEARKLLATLETLDREAEKVRKEEKEPHLQACQEVDGKFRTPRAELARVTSRLRERIGERAVARERAAAQAKAEAMEAASRRDAEATNAALERAALVAVPVQANGVGESFSWEIEGFVLAQVPPEFLAIDLTKVKAYVKDCDRAGKEPQIPGVRFRRVANLRVSSVR